MLSLVLAHAAVPQWRDSTDGIHAFLTFDSAMEHQKANITAFASRIDYVWGASAAGPGPPLACHGLNSNSK